MEWLSKIFDWLKIKFCNRYRSPSTNVKAKSNQQKVAATAGPNSPIDMSECKTINHYHTRPKKILENEDSWRDLINSYSAHSAQYIANDLLNPLLDKSQQDGNYIITWVSQKFAAIDIPSDAIEAVDFIDARDQSIDTIKQLVHSKNHDSFCKKWMAIGKTLTKVKQAVNKND